MKKSDLNQKHYDQLCKPAGAGWRMIAQQHSRISIEYAIFILEELKDMKLLSPTVWEYCNVKIEELKKLL